MKELRIKEMIIKTQPVRIIITVIPAEIRADLSRLKETTRKEALLQRVK